MSLVNDIPFMLVCEEAHNYIPKNGGAEYAASRHSIERIAKEGRKYGLNLMVVSQRPSEVSETIFSQCNNFLVLKLTNVNDQNCIHDLRHSHISLLIDMGFTALAIAERVGHESIDITYRYAHLFPTRQVEMADKLDSLKNEKGV